MNKIGKQFEKFYAFCWFTVDNVRNDNIKQPSPSDTVYSSVTHESFTELRAKVC